MEFQHDLGNARMDSERAIFGAVSILNPGIFSGRTEESENSRFWVASADPMKRL